MKFKRYVVQNNNTKKYYSKGSWAGDTSFDNLDNAKTYTTQGHAERRIHNLNWLKLNDSKEYEFLNTMYTIKKVLIEIKEVK